MLICIVVFDVCMAKGRCNGLCETLGPPIGASLGMWHGVLNSGNMGGTEPKKSGIDYDTESQNSGNRGGTEPKKSGMY